MAQLEILKSQQRMNRYKRYQRYSAAYLMFYSSFIFSSARQQASPSLFKPLS